jgi:diketogulonate reductase-like aldo/keto reductase
MKTVSLPDGTKVPALGQGTWRMGESKSAHNAEVSALKLGIELGMTLIDTAEMYGDGRAEEVVADVISGQRDGVFIVTKAYPQNASRERLPQACERSLKRLRTDTIDLYLVHWREKSTRLAETVDTFEKLRAQGKIRHWGVSNFDVPDMKDLFAVPNGGNCATNQILYNLQYRGIEFDLLPWQRDRKMPVMAYSPVGHGRGLLENGIVQKIAQRHNASASQIALGWLLREPNVIVIPKASEPKHVRENARSMDLQFTRDDLPDLDREFPPPKAKQALALL